MRSTSTLSTRKTRFRPNRRASVRELTPRRPLWSGVDWERVRFRLAAGLFAALWVMLWFRAFYVQLIRGPELEIMAERQHSYTELVEARRGNIYDRNGQALARSVECRSIYANPREVADIEATAAALAPILNADQNALFRQLNQKRSFVWLARKVDDATALAVQKAGLAGVGMTREYERVYPFRHLAGQLLGFVGLDNKGLEGLEHSFDNVLAGMNQRNVIQRDGTGRRFYLGGEGDNRGEDLYLTLDVQLQFIAEDVIAEAVESAKAGWGGVIIADVNSGDILAWAQYPFFNPNDFRHSSPSVYRNRLAADALEPGSTLKPFLMAAALEEGAITRDTEFFCENGVWDTQKTVIRDDGRAYGNLRASKILPYSSNIGMAKIALEVGARTYYTYLTRLGFGQRTGIGVGESRGIVRQPHEWSEVDLMSTGFGQSVSVTGVQMVQGFVTLAGDGLFRPLRLIMDREGHATSGAEQRIFSRATAQAVLRMMEDTVDGDGTGKRARIPGLHVAGKTGTAQKAEPGRAGGYGDKRTATFAGIVPSDQPRYVIYVILDEPTTTQYGGVLAAPVFQKVASRALAYGGYLPGVVFASDSTPRPGAGARPAVAAKNAARTVQPGITPDAQGQSLRRAMEMFAQAGVVPDVRGEGLVVARQEPAPGKPCLDADGRPLPCVVWMEDSGLVAQAAQTEPKAAEAKAVNPVTAKAGAPDAKAAKRAATETKASKSKATDSKAVKPGASKSKTTEPGTAKSKAATPVTAKAKAPKTAVPKSSVAAKR